MLLAEALDGESQALSGERRRVALKVLFLSRPGLLDEQVRAAASAERPSDMRIADALCAAMHFCWPR